MKIFKTTLGLCSFLALCACTNSTTTQNSAESTQQKQSVIKEETTDKEEAEGVKFLDITLEQALEKAKSEGKTVFIDFYLKTCAPCKKMEKIVFTTKECGEYINNTFIPIKIDGEDDGVGTEMTKQYKIFIYPTCLIIAPDGNKLGEINGAEFDVNKFIESLNEIIKQQK